MTQNKQRIDGVSQTSERPFFVHCKKHYCPDCKEQLGTMKAWDIVHSGSEESKKYDFSCGDTYLCGNIKFIWTVFVCAKCEKTYSVGEIYQLEKAARKAERKKSGECNHFSMFKKGVNKEK